MSALNGVGIDLYWTSPTEAGDYKHQRTYRVEMNEGIKGKATLQTGRVITELIGGQGM